MISWIRTLVFPLYEQEPMEQVGALASVLFEEPEVLNEEICFTGSRAPHLGQTGGSCRDDRTRWSNFSPQSLHLYSKIGIILLS